MVFPCFFHMFPDTGGVDNQERQLTLVYRKPRISKRGGHLRTYGGSGTIKHVMFTLVFHGGYPEG